MKKALLVGINHYQLPGNDLHGCLNDIASMKCLLKAEYGFRDTDIEVLLDTRATKSNIVKSLTNLVATNAADILFHYSGHGTRYYNQATKENDDAICPFDAKDISTLISGHELAAIFSKIPPTSKLSFIADCCHSGTIDREFQIIKVCCKKIMYIPGIAKPSGSTPNKKVLTHGDHLLLSGCRDDQTSTDSWFYNVPHGALTYSILQSIQENPKQTWRQLHVNIKTWLARNGYDQVPQLSGPDALADKLLFT